MLGAALLALSLAACSNGDPDDPAPAGDPPPGDSAPATGTPRAADGDAAPAAGIRRAVDGDTVLVHYHGTLADGEVFDSSRGRDPFSFTVGAGQVIPGFDEAVRGLAVGESVTARLEPEQAYGPRQEALQFTVPRGEVPPDVTAGVMLRTADGAQAVVIAVDDETVALDANHPLAGQTLTFELELVAIQ